MEGQIKKRPIIPRMGRRIVLTKLMAKRRPKRHDSNLPIHTTTTAGTSQNLPYLPPEILQHILSHLPLDAYFRAKSLGRFWVSQLSNPTSMKPHSIIVVQSRLSKAHGSYWKDLVGVEIGKSITDLDYCFKFCTSPGELRHIIGACNGFLCIRVWHPFPVDDEDYIIYNPVTRECLSLPQPPIEIFGRLVMYGFGGTSSGVYKVALFTVEDTIVLSSGTIGWRREKRWERVPLAGEWDGSCKDGVCFEGSLHWIGRECVIVFELEVESFLQFSFPPQVDNRYITTVGVLDKYLSLVVVSEFDIKLYTMNQYGRDDSWELRRVVENQPYELQTKVLKYGDVGQLIILHDDQLGIIASGENQIVSVKITKPTKNGNVMSVKTAFVFLPTLLSLTDAGFLIHPQDRT